MLAAGKLLRNACIFGGDVSENVASSFCSEDGKLRPASIWQLPPFQAPAQGVEVLLIKMKLPEGT